jgi:hypothetical protein
LWSRIIFYTLCSDKRSVKEWSVVVIHRIPVPQEVHSLGLLDRVDYSDAFEARTTSRHTPREWGDLIVEQSSPAVLALVRAAHSRVGRMPLLPQDADHPLGWSILEETDTHLVIGIDGGIATPRVVIWTSPGRVVFATALRYESSGARAIWAAGRHVHRAVARYLVTAATTTHRSNRCLK